MVRRPRWKPAGHGGCRKTETERARAQAHRALHSMITMGGVGRRNTALGSVSRLWCRTSPSTGRMKSGSPSVQYRNNQTVTQVAARRCHYFATDRAKFAQLMP
ncbi:hypothetical protein SI859A1_02466 [Aurantimonas manganoxydans SI85-9A1]|uniref:Uncharacterized protein n=1 Tax=Aurantimonas manganoxydans (strain ATCC BAA-1229 / DSM 21871 / SI85-9A1) TaxID=287752 RepID=Q1YLT1_AURMS|nr:hypothetical protein SI859A1_02466 [Aurantimonas manganoxydans SI85-9A1]